MSPAWVIGIEIWMEAASSIIGLLVGIYSLKAYKIVGDRSLLFLNTSFLMLGSGMLTRVLVLLYLVVIRRLQITVGPRLFLLEVANWIYVLSTLVAYFLLAIAYAEKGWRKSLVATQSVFLLEVSAPLLALNLIDIFLLMYVCLNLLSSYISERNRGQLFVLVGFLLILSSHTIPLLALVYRPVLFLEASVRLVGFLSLFIALARVAFHR